MSLRGRATQIGLRLDATLLGSLVQMVRANRKVRSRIGSDELDSYKDDPRLEHPLPILQAARDASVARLQRIEDKAKQTVLGVGIGVTVIGSASAFLGKDGPVANSPLGFKITLAFLLGGAIVFLLISGYLALRAYEIGQVWLPSLLDTPPLVSEAEAKMMELQDIDQNDRMGTVRANFLSAAFDCLRNGLAALALAGLVFLALSCTAVPGGTALQPPACHGVQSVSATQGRVPRQLCSSDRTFPSAGR